MNSKLNITEQDIFEFVFYNEILEESKRNFINNNKEKFTYQIGFYEKIKNFKQTDVSDQEIENLIAKINSVERIVTLYPNKEFEGKKTYTLAAASYSLDKKITSSTLTDRDSQYMIRVIKYPNHSEVIVFSADLKPINKYKLTIYPDKIEYLGDRNTRGFKVKDLNVIEKIKLEILKD